MAHAGEIGAEGVDEGALADTGHAGDADAPGLAGVGQQGLEQLDLFLIHWPLPTLYDGDFVSTWKAMVGLLADGRLKTAGVSNFQPDHLDRIIEHRPDVALAGAPPAQGLGALEIKTVNEMALRKWKRHGLPLAYILQLQHGMAVTGLKWGSFALLEPTSWTLLWFDEPRDEGLIGKIEMAARLFWPTVDDEPPPRLDPNSVQCGRCKYRTSCQGEKLESLAMSKDDEMDWGPAPFREDMGALLAEYFELSDIAREAGDLLEAHKDLIRDAMGKEERANAPGAKIYYTESRPSRWDTKALEAAGLAAKYKKQGAPQRTLRIYPR